MTLSLLINTLSICVMYPPKLRVKVRMVDLKIALNVRNSK